MAVWYAGFGGTGSTQTCIPHGHLHRVTYTRARIDTICCILRGPGGEGILDVVPRGTELGTQVKKGSRAGRTHPQ